jgi:hypothetical protein
MRAMACNIKDILLGDECFGIAYLENRIVVNCKEKGLIVINLNGTWEKEHSKVTGELSLHAGLEYHTGCQIIQLFLRASQIFHKPLTKDCCCQQELLCRFAILECL